MSHSTNCEANAGIISHEDVPKEVGVKSIPSVVSSSKSVSNSAISNGSVGDEDDASSKENCDSGQISDGAASSNNNSDGKAKTKKKGSFLCFGYNISTPSERMMKTRNYRLATFLMILLYGCFFT